MNTKRRFIPGDEWLYFKVYSGPKFLEEILINEIYTVAESLYSSNCIDKFFFVRYMDDGHHLRLRFHLADAVQAGTVMHKVSTALQAYTESRLISKVTLDTYNREIERYGAFSIEHLETLFSVSSWHILEVLRSENEYESRWLHGIRLADQLLQQFGLSVTDRYELYESYYKAYAQEFGSGGVVLESLKKKYREAGKKIAAVLSDDSGAPSVISSPAFVRGYDQEQAVGCILQLKEQSRLEVPFDQLLKSLLHMHYNRLFRVKQRQHEFVLYYMLSNFYKSLSIRMKMQEKVKT